MSMERLMGGMTTHKPLVATTATLGSGCDFMAIRAAPVRILQAAALHLGMFVLRASIAEIRRYA